MPVRPSQSKTDKANHQKLWMPPCQANQLAMGKSLEDEKEKENSTKVAKDNILGTIKKVSIGKNQFGKVISKCTNIYAS